MEKMIVALGFFYWFMYLLSGIAWAVTGKVGQTMYYAVCFVLCLSAVAILDKLDEIKEAINETKTNTEKEDKG